MATTKLSTDAEEFPKLYRGIVEDNKDPKKLGRCRVRVPSIHGSLDFKTDLLPWARPITQTPVSHGRGSVILPDKGDVVWVMFESGDKEYPVYFGGTYGYITDETAPDCPTCRTTAST